MWSESISLVSMRGTTPRYSARWGKNVGVSIAVFFAFVVLLSVANGLVRNGEIPDACAVDAIVSCQRASLLSRFIER